MYVSTRRIQATPTTRVDDTVVRLNIGGEDATIDLDENPAYHAPAQVAELTISYTTTTTHTDGGDTVTITSAVTGITYRVADKDYATVSVHPDFLDQPDEWPAWVRDLVAEYKPAT